MNKVLIVEKRPRKIRERCVFCPLSFILYLLSGNKTLIQKEILNPDILNAIVVPPRFHIIFHHDDFLEGIRNSDQGSNLLFLLIRIIDGQSGLNIATEIFAASAIFSRYIRSVSAWFVFSRHSMDSQLFFFKIGGR